MPSVVATMQVMDVDSSSLKTEVDAFVRWARELELTAQARPGGLSRWYGSEVLRAYVRSTRWKLALRGELALCLADIEVAEAYRSRGLLTRLVAELQVSDTLQAKYLYVENVMNPRFVRWLEHAGFTRRLQSGEFPSFYQRRRVVG